MQRRPAGTGSLLPRIAAALLSQLEALRAGGAEVRLQAARSLSVGRPSPAGTSMAALPRLHSAYAVEQAILGEKSKVVCLRVGEEFEPDCIRMDEVLREAVGIVEGACSIYAVDKQEVPECVQEFQVTEPMATLFFFRGKLLPLDLGAGGRQKGITWVVSGRQEFIELVEAVCRGAQQGRDFIVAPKDYSMSFRY